MMKEHNVPTLVACLENTALKVVDSLFSGIFPVSNAPAMMTLIISHPSNPKTRNFYKKWQQIDIKDFSEWEVSRWLKKYWQ